jgi:hypothetical protein
MRNRRKWWRRRWGVGNNDYQPYPNTNANTYTNTYPNTYYDQ